MKLFAPGLSAGRHRGRLPGNVNVNRGSVLTPVLESVAAVPAYLPTTSGARWGIQVTCPGAKWREP